MLLIAGSSCLWIVTRLGRVKHEASFSHGSSFRSKFTTTSPVPNFLLFDRASDNDVARLNISMNLMSQHCLFENRFSHICLGDDFKCCFAHSGCNHNSCMIWQEHSSRMLLMFLIQKCRHCGIGLYYSLTRCMQVLVFEKSQGHRTTYSISYYHYIYYCMLSTSSKSMLCECGTRKMMRKRSSKRRRRNGAHCKMKITPYTEI